MWVFRLRVSLQDFRIKLICCIWERAFALFADTVRLCTLEMIIRKVHWNVENVVTNCMYIS